MVEKTARVVGFRPPRFSHYIWGAKKGEFRNWTGAEGKYYNEIEGKMYINGLMDLQFLKKL